MNDKGFLQNLSYQNLKIKIGKREVGYGKPCFIVAEMSANHIQDFKIAEGTIKAAAQAGADAIKLQTYTPDTETLKSNNKWFKVGGKTNPKEWVGKSLFELYQTAYMPWEWQPKLKKLANSLGLQLFSTSVDISGIDFLEKMGVPCYKVASYELIHDPLLKRIAKTGKPVILSSGYATEEEIVHALGVLRRHGTKKIALLHCVTGYSDKPKAEEMNLRTIRDINERFGVVAGFSDNNAGDAFSKMAVLCGASIIEKHLILNRNLRHTKTKELSPDVRFSIEPKEFSKMVKNIRLAEKSLGNVKYGPANKIESYNRRWRPSLFASNNIAKGEIFTKNNVRVVRPNAGIDPSNYEKIIGKKSAKNIEFASPISWEAVSKK